MSGIGGTAMQQLIKSFRAMDMEVRIINSHEFYCDGKVYTFDASGEHLQSELKSHTGGFKHRIR